MSTVINGSSPSITFSDGTTQTTSAFGTGSNLYSTGTNIGIGTNSPSNKLTIQADATGASFADNGIAQFLVEGLTDYTKRIGVGIDTTNNVGVIQAQKYGTGTYPLSLNPAGGNVGIGTNNPSVALEVAGASKFTNGNVSIVPSTTTSAAAFIATNGGGTFFVGLDNSSGSTFGAGAYGSVLYNGANTPMVFYTNGSERMRINTSGNLLVGSTATVTNTVGGHIYQKLGDGTVLEGAGNITVNTSTALLSRASGIGGFAILNAYNTSTGAQGTWLVSWNTSSGVSVVSAQNGTGLTVNFSASGGTLQASTTSGTLSMAVFAITV